MRHLFSPTFQFFRYLYLDNFRLQKLLSFLFTMIRKNYLRNLLYEHAWGLSLKHYWWRILHRGSWPGIWAWGGRQQICGLMEVLVNPKKHHLIHQENTLRLTYPLRHGYAVQWKFWNEICQCFNLQLPQNQFDLKINVLLLNWVLEVQILICILQFPIVLFRKLQ